MNNLRLPKQDSATGRGLKTGAQAIIGFVTTFIVGLLLTVWNVPGVPDAVIAYCQDHFLEVALMIGVPAGMAGFVWNYFRKGVSNY